MNDDRNWRRLAWGILIMGLGVVFLAERLGFMPPWLGALTWWPLFVIALGLVRLVRPRRAKDISSAVMFTLLGLWFLGVANDWFGLTWQNSWPLALVAVGASAVARALASRWIPDTYWVSSKEEHHG